jgi:y4mF family transcriptional regulator
MAVNISLHSAPMIGRIVHFHRKQAGLSRLALADIAGIGKTAVYDIEKGKPTVRLNTLLQLFEALNLKVSLDSPLMDRYKAGSDAQS